MDSLGTASQAWRLSGDSSPETHGELRLPWEEQVETELGSRVPEGHVQCGEAEPEAMVRAAGPQVSPGLHLTPPWAP